MAGYTETISISLWMRITLLVLALVSVAVFCICLVLGFRQYWFFAVVAAALGYICGLRSIRGSHVVSRDDGEP